MEIFQNDCCLVLSETFPEIGIDPIVINFGQKDPDVSTLQVSLSATNELHETCHEHIKFIIFNNNKKFPIMTPNCRACFVLYAGGEC